MSDKFKFRIFIIFSIIVLCIGLTIRELQNDTFYMIKLGDFIVNNGIDLKDHWCWISELSYTYPHWLYDVFLFLVYDNFGFIGIYISTIIVFICLILLVYFINLKINKNEFMAFFVSIVSVFSLFLFATARSQLFSYIIFILEVYFIYMLINSGKKRYIIYLMILSLVLANVHATIWMFYFILFLPFVGEKIIYYFVKRFNIKLNEKFLLEKTNNFKLLLISLGLCFFMGLFSPSRICYTYIFKIMMGNSQSFITEHFPLVIIKNPLFMMFSILILLVLIFTNTKIKFRELFMICGLMFMSLCSVRHTALFYLISMLYISILCMRYFNDKGDRTFDVLENLMIKNRVVYVLMFMLVGILGCFKFYNNMDTDYINKKLYPVDAVKYIKENINLNDYRGYNGYNYGSYLMFNDIPVFIDSRCDLYLKEFNNKELDIFEYNANIFDFYEKTFEKLDVNYVLISNDNNLFKVLSKDKNYIVDYKDKYFTLFNKKVFND